MGKKASGFISLQIDHTLDASPRAFREIDSPRQMVAVAGSPAEIPSEIEGEELHGEDSDAPQLGLTPPRVHTPSPGMVDMLQEGDNPMDLSDQFDNDPSFDADITLQDSLNDVSIPTQEGLPGKFGDEEEEGEKLDEMTFLETLRINQHRHFTPPVIAASKLQQSPRMFTPRKPLQSLSAAGSLDAASPLRGGGGEAGEDKPRTDGMMDLIYDPILNCYYDAKTNKYFTLK